MSTLYGLDASDGEAFNLCVVDTNTGTWTPVGPAISVPNPGYTPNGLMWNPTNSTMYMTAVDTSTGLTNLYTLDLMSNVATLVVVIDAVTQLSQGFIRGLSYDPINERTYCVSPQDSEFGMINTTYFLDLSNGDLTRIGNPSFVGVLNESTLFDGNTLYGVGLALTGDLQMYVIHNNGVWIPTSSSAGFQPGFTAPFGVASTFDPYTGLAYGGQTSAPFGLPSTWLINLTDGSWQLIGPTGLDNPQAMTAVQSICVSADTAVELVGGQQKVISEIQEGDLVVDYRGKLVQVERCVVSGHTKKFIQIPRNAFGLNQPREALLIRDGHPLLVNKLKVPCEALVGRYGIQTVELAKPIAIFTLVTQMETFVQMNGISVGTWSPESFRNFNEHK